MLFTAIWTNGETDLGWALPATLAFGVLGIVLNTVMFLVIEVITPGDLRSIVTAGRPGPPPGVRRGGDRDESSAAIVCASIA